MVRKRPRRSEEGWRMFVKADGGAWMDGLGGAALVGEDLVEMLGVSVSDEMFFLA